MHYFFKYAIFLIYTVPIFFQISGAETSNIATSEYGQIYPWKAKELPFYCDPEDDWAKDPSVIQVGQIFYMYYTNAIPWQKDGAGGRSSGRIDYATSTDGIKWTYQGPAIAKGELGEWDDERPQAPAKPIFKDGVYYMFYTGKSSHSPVAIGYATSTNLKKWTKNPGNPILSNGKCNDSFIFQENGIYYLLHTSGGDAVRYVTSNDLLTWSRTPVSTAAIGGGSIVIKDGSTYSMFGCIGFSDQGEFYGTYTSQDIKKPFIDCEKTTITVPDCASGSLCHGDIIRKDRDYWFYFQASKDGVRRFQIGLAKTSVSLLPK